MAVYNVCDYGAKADGKTLSSQGIQRAVDACAQGGGGTVTVPAGVYKCGTVRLKSNVELHLEHGAVLCASENMSDYNAEDEYEQNYGDCDEEWRGKHLILCVEQHNVALTGGGVIDGNGGAYYGAPARFDSYIWKEGLALSKDKEKLRPGQTVCFIECEHVKIEGVGLRNTTCWGFFLHGCEHVQIHGVSVFNPPYYANTDGIDIDACRYVTVSDCIIDTGDDAIAVRSASQRLKNKNKVCEFITVTNCVLASSSSVFRLGVGYGAIRHVRISNIAIARGGVGLHVLSAFHGHRTPITDVGFYNISAENVERPLEMLASQDAPIDGVTVENFRSDGTMGCVIGNSDRPTLHNVRLRGVEITMKDFTGTLTEKVLRYRGNSMLSCRGVDGLQLTDVRLRADATAQTVWQKDIDTEHCTNE